MEDNTYNGWTNYETWCANLWMDQDYYTGVESGCDNVNELAERMKSDAEEIMPDTGESGLWTDLMQASFDTIDWREIAEHYVVDAQLDSDIDEKVKALANHLGIDVDEVDDTGYSYETDDGEEYLVMTDDEADAAVFEHIKESVWAFNPAFLLTHTDSLSDVAPIEALCYLCEGGNGGLVALINDFDHFVDDAIACDGRGHFLSGYDGEEIEYIPDTGEMLFIYRIG